MRSVIEAGTEASSPHFLSPIELRLWTLHFHLSWCRLERRQPLLPCPWAYPPRPLAGCYGRHCAPCRFGAPTLTSARRSCPPSSASALPTDAPKRAYIISSPCPQAPTAIPMQNTSVARIRECTPVPSRHAGSTVNPSSSTTNPSALTLPHPIPDA